MCFGYLIYIGGWVNEVVFQRIYSDFCVEVDLLVVEFGGGVCCWEIGDLCIWVNYGVEFVEILVGIIEVVGVLFEKIQSVL